MKSILRFLPWLDLRGHRLADSSKDAMAALVLTMISVPQLIAYAVIAGLPPVMGLYAATFPTIIGSLLRSSRHVITGPSNAVSLLVGGGVAMMAGTDPLQTAIALALLVGLFQLAAGLLRLGAVVDYISNPVVLGYITGAGLLIAIGQLPNLTGTLGASGHVGQKIWGWVQGLGSISWLALVIATSTAVLILLLKKWKPSWPGPLIVIALATFVSTWFSLPAQGIKVVSDISPVPNGFPPFTVPDLALMWSMAPLAFACTVLSLVESSAVARAIASRSGQRIDASVEFAGQGVANITAAFCGGYPTSGSLGRSVLNEQAGAQSRMAGVYSGVMMLLVLLFLGPLANTIPIAALAGFLMILAYGLIDSKRIKVTLKSELSDKLAFLATLVGTWMVPLDKAIYLGVGISLILFLRKARFLVVRELAVDEHNRLREVDENTAADECRSCKSIRIVHLEGRLFFGVKGELQSILDRAMENPETKVVVVRLKRTQGMDVTISEVFAVAAERMKAEGRHLLLAGIRADALAVLKQTGTAELVGEDHLFPSQARWFSAMGKAVEFARDLVCHNKACDQCPLKHYLDTQGRINESLPG